MDENEYSEEPVCLFCGSKNLYRDRQSDDLICSECGSQSQSLSQRETTEEDNIMGATKRKSGSIRKKKSVIIEEDEIEEEFRIPSLLECTEAFLSLVEIAAKKSVSEDLIPRLDHVQGFSNYRQRIVEDAREIFFLFLERWDESANYFMIMYPGLRISLKDKFLTQNLKERMILQINAALEGKFGEKQQKSESDSDDDTDDSHFVVDEKGPQSLSKSPNNETSSKRVRWGDSQDTLLFDSQDASVTTPIRSRMGENWDESSSTDLKNSWQILKSKIEKPLKKNSLILKDDSNYLKLAILELSVGLNLASSIVYLAHLCAHTGVASNHFVMWAKMGKFPYLLDGYGQLGEDHKENLKNIKSRWRQNRNEIPKPQKLEQVAFILLSCLVDPNDERENFLSELYRLNATRIECQKALEGKNLKKLLIERDEVKEMKTIDDNMVVEDIHEEESLQQSHINAFHLGQYSQESDESVEIVNVVPKSLYNVGTMCNMFCANLGVESRVLDFAYAIMGIPVYCNKRDASDENSLDKEWSQKGHVSWLPAALKLAHPSRLVSPAHVIAVIVVACKFCPGWEQWIIQLSHEKGFLTSNECEETSISSDEHGKQMKKRKKIGPIGGRFSRALPDMSKVFPPPSYDRNGEKTFDYLDSIPQKEKKARFTSDDFKESLRILSKEPPSVRKRKKGKKYNISGSTNLSGGNVWNKKRSNSMQHSLKLSHDHGLSEYLAYKRSEVQHSTGVHGAYGTLLSFVADRLCVDRKVLHYLVTGFDEEIIEYAQIARMKKYQSYRWCKNLLTSSSNEL